MEMRKLLTPSCKTYGLGKTKVFIENQCDKKYHSIPYCCYACGEKMYSTFTFRCENVCWSLNGVTFVTCTGENDNGVNDSFSCVS